MIQCPHCQIGYSPSYERCPGCGQYSTPREDRVLYFGRTAEEYAEQNVSHNEIRSYLIENGLSDAEADEALATALSHVRRRNRSYGVSRMVVSLGLMLIGGLVLAFVALAIAGYIRRPKDVAFAGAIIIGLAFTGAGGTLLVRSVWMMTTGR